MAYDIKIHIGIGDLILSKSLLLSVPGKVCVRLGYEHLHYKAQGYKQFIYELAKKILHEDKFEVSEDGQCPPTMWHDMVKNGMVPVPISLRNELCSGRSLGVEYICVHMKVREYDFKTMNANATTIADAINAVSERYKVVLIGEREVELTPEYAILDQKYMAKSAYSCYPLFYGRLNNVIDLTIPKLGLTLPTMESFMQDCLYMSEAKANINFGFGGNFQISSAVGKTIGVLSPGMVIPDFYENRPIKTFSIGDLVSEILKLR